MTAPRSWQDYIEGFVRYMRSRGWRCGWIIFGRRVCPIYIGLAPIVFGPMRPPEFPVNDNRRGRR